MIENINLNGATVSAELHGFMYNNVWGYTGVFKYGSAMEAEIVSNNEIKIKDGLLCNYGRFMRISGYESIAIENGTSGVARTDLIVAHFESDGINETHDIRVIRGTSGGEVPSYTTGDIYSGDTINELPLYAIHLNGLTVESVEKLFGDLLSFDELRNNVSNQNLLINSDFRNPVNQRGKTEYILSNTWTYTIDRWCGFYNKISVEDGYLKIAQNTSTDNTYFKQIFENALPMGNYSITVNVLALSGTITLTVAGVSHTLAVGKNTFTFENCSPAQLQLTINGSGAYVDIEYIKLEQGSFATPYIPRPFAEELALCQRYLFPIEEWACSYTERGDNNYYNVFIPGIIMRTNPTPTETPTVQIAGITGSSVIAMQSISTFLSCYQRRGGIEIMFGIGTTYGINFGVAVFSKSFLLDAEIY